MTAAHRPALQRRPEVRDRMRLAIGTRPAADLTVEFVEAVDHDEVRPAGRRHRDRPAGARRRGAPRPAASASPASSRTRSSDCPPTCVVIARAADRWLAAYAEVDATLIHPLDPMTTGQTVAALLRQPAAGVPRTERDPPSADPRPPVGGPPWASAPGRSCSTALLRGEELSTGDTAWAMGEIMAGDGHPGPDRRRSRSRCGPRARRRPRSPAWSRRCSAAAARSRCPTQPRARRGRHRRHRRRPGPHGEHLHHGRARRRRRRASGWSSTATGPPPRPAAPPTCWSASASRSTSARRRWPGASPRPASASASPPASTPGMRHAAVTRREMGVPTVFNFLGPLTNPARPRGRRGRLLRRADGAGDGRGVRRPRRLGAGDARRGRAGRVHHRRADPGLGGRRRHGHARRVLDAVDLGLPRVPAGRPARRRRGLNADVARRVLAGEPGPVRDAVLLNAAAALAAQGRAGRTIWARAVAAGMARAAEAIDSGAAAEVLRRWVEVAKEAQAAA